MGCTTILVGKKATYDGSTMIARNDDSGAGHFTAKKFAVVSPEQQPKTYHSVLSHVTIELPENPMRYTAMPNAVEGKGIWAASGVNEAHGCWERIRWSFISLQRMERKRLPEESGKRIWFVWCFLISEAPERAFYVLAACWSNTGHMR